MKKAFFIFFVFASTYSMYGQKSGVDSIIYEGIKLHDKGKYAKALKIYKDVLEKHPNSAFANYEYAYTCNASGDLKNAIKYSKKVIDNDKEHVMGAYIIYGNSLDMSGKPHEAIKAYEKALKKYDHYMLLYNYALTCKKVGKPNMAYSSVIKAIKKNPWHVGSNILLSNIMLERGSKIKSILPLYFALYSKPNSKISKDVYKTLKQYIYKGITKKSEKNIYVNISTGEKDTSFLAAEVLVGTLVASEIASKNDNTELQKFAEINNTIFSTLGELKKDQTGFWWDTYVDFLYNISKNNHTEVFSYYISLSQGDEVIEWFDKNKDKLDKYKKWSNKN